MDDFPKYEIKTFVNILLTFFDHKYHKSLGTMQLEATIIIIQVLSQVPQKNYRQAFTSNSSTASGYTSLGITVGKLF